MKKIILFFSVVLQCFDGYTQPTVVWTETYSDSTYGYTLVDAIKDNSGNVIVFARALKNSNLDKDPVLVKYDHSGNLILNWIHYDTVAFESPFQVIADSINNLYVLTVTGNISADSTHLIKIDGATGQEIFNYSFGNSIYGLNAIGINHQYLYLALGFPVLQIYKYDLQGNLIWNKPIPIVHRLKKFHFYNEDIYLVGDTISSPYFVDLIQKFDSSGTLQWQTATLNADSYNYRDSEIDSASNLWISGNTSTNIKGYLSKIDSTGAVWDTLLPSNSGAGKIATNYQNDIFWVYSVIGETLDILKINAGGNSQFASVDTNGGDHDINCLYNGNVIMATSRKVTILDRDYELSSFDANGNLNWNLVYSHTPTSIEKVFRLFADSSFTYLVGEKKDSATGSTQINVIRIDYPTGIDEPNLAVNGLTVYPNPVIDNQINFNMPLNDVCILLYDCYGRIVQRNNHFTGSTLFLHQSLTLGIYFLEIANEKFLLKKKLLKY
ncbi:MAG: T9SS type A sorting domain-containing protein [Arcticibacter sp.]